MKQKNYPLYNVKEFGSIREMLLLASKEAGDRYAFKYKDKNSTLHEITYNSFRQDTVYLGTAIESLECGECHISAIGENSYDWVTVYLSVLQSKNVFVPIDKDLPDKDLLYVLNDCDSSILFYAKKHESFIRENRASLPAFKYFIGFEREENDGEFLSYEKLIAAGKKEVDSGNNSFEKIRNNIEKLKMVVYTSGTTGLAKGVMLSEKNLVFSVYYGLQVSTVYDICLSVLPYHHTYEGVCGILVSLHMHATICINDNLRNTAKNLLFYKPSYIIIVPALAEVLYNKVWLSAAEKKMDVKLKKLIAFSNSLRNIGIDLRKPLFKTLRAAFGGNLRKIVCGGAPIRPEIGEFFDSIGIDLINGYGITECSPLVSANRDRFNDFRTTGVKLPCIDVKLDDVTGDGEGEICVKGPIVMMGYYKNPEATKAVLSDDGWFKTGDYGKINELGQISITGRKKNVIVLANGKNIYPEEIEGYISAIPLVSEVIVSAFKDDLGNESALCAEIFPNLDMLKALNITDTLDALKTEIRKQLDKLPSYKQVTKIIVRDQEFEKTTSRKIKRNAARQEIKKASV
ncbi:MAG: AMP-binding protein [Oscillospiraceae bacterium]|nr:AMP-binding protein [Oscillospiraceae bacterium]